MPNLNFDVRMTNSANMVGENRRIGLRIEDFLSGETLIDIDFTPDQFVALLANAGVRAEGFITGHPERVGKAQRVENLMITSVMLGDLAFHDGAEEAARAIAEEHLSVLNDATPGHRLRYVSQTNSGGYRAVYDRWEEPTQFDLDRAAGKRF